MKISMIGPVYPYRGGIAHYTTSLALALEKAGHDVQVLSFRRQYPAFLYPGQSDKDPSTNPVRVDASFVLDPLYPWTWHEAMKVVARGQPDLLLIQWWTTFWGPAYSWLVRQARQRKVPVVYLIHNVLPHETRRWDRPVARLALSPASGFIIQAPHEQQKLLDLIPGARISYCSHPVYQQMSEDFVPKDTARQRLGLPADQLLFLFFGIMRPYKGLIVLLDALAQLKEPAHLVIAGEFWEDVARYRKQIADLGLSERVTLLDRYIPNEEAHLLFSAADALLAPYVGGTQSGSVELAVGYGLPAIVTDRIAAGISEANLSNMQVVPAGDIPSLAAALARFARDLPARQASRHVSDDWGRMVAAIVNIHADLQGTAK